MNCEDLQNAAATRSGNFNFSLFDENQLYSLFHGIYDYYHRQWRLEIHFCLLK